VVNAVIVVRPENYGVNAARCLEYCETRRYHVVGLIPGDWRAALRMLGDGLAGVIVVSARDQFDAPGEPRIEVAPKRSARRPRKRTANAALPGQWAADKPARSVLGR